MTCHMTPSHHLFCHCDAADAFVCRNGSCFLSSLVGALLNAFFSLHHSLGFGSPLSCCGWFFILPSSCVGYWVSLAFVWVIEIVMFLVFAPAVSIHIFAHKSKNLCSSSEVNLCAISDRICVIDENWFLCQISTALV
eukprot:840271_1